MTGALGGKRSARPRRLSPGVPFVCSQKTDHTEAAVLDILDSPSTGYSGQPGATLCAGPVFFLDRGALEDLACGALQHSAFSGWEGGEQMKKKTYLIVAPADERKADYMLTMADCDDPCRCW